MLTQVQVQGIQWHQCSERVWKLQPQSVHVLNKRLRESGQASCAKVVHRTINQIDPNRIPAPVKHASSPNRCKRVWSIRPKQCWTSLAILMTYWQDWIFSRQFQAQVQDVQAAMTVVLKFTAGDFSSPWPVTHDTHGDISTSRHLDIDHGRPLGSRAWGRSQSPDFGGGAVGHGWTWISHGLWSIVEPWVRAVGFPRGSPNTSTSQRNPRLLMLLPAWFTHWMVAFESGVDRKVSHHLPWLPYDYHCRILLFCVLGENL